MEKVGDRQRFRDFDVKPFHVAFYLVSFIQQSHSSTHSDPSSEQLLSYVPVVDANNNARRLQQWKVKMFASQQNHPLATVEN